MIRLPFLALSYLFSRPRLFVLGVIPGFITFTASCAVAYLAWLWLLSSLALWAAIPALVLVLLISWIFVGKLALLPVEDPIIDECQKALFGELRHAAPRFSISRILAELLFSGKLLLVALLVLSLSLLPLLAPLQFILLSWLNAYGFLAAIYSRFEAPGTGRVRLFFRNPVSHFFLGALLSLLLFVPVLNVFLLGYAQTLATLWYFHSREPVSPMGKLRG